MRETHCAACGASENLRYHPLVPRNLGGTDEDTNLITLCGDCHAKAQAVRKAGARTSTTPTMTKQVFQAYQCSQCAAIYDWRVKADACCVGAVAVSLLVPKYVCTVCARSYFDPREAADCCGGAER